MDRSWRFATARARIKGGGASNSSALGFGGISSPPSNSVAITESWDGTSWTWNGSSWTEVNDLNTPRYYLGGFGNATSAIASNGINPGASPGYTQNRIEKWDGTSWTQ